MEKINVKLAPSSHYNILVDQCMLSLLQAMSPEGRIMVDRFQIQNNQAITILNPREINLLHIIGIPVIVGQELVI
ncbi:MAG TPA: hypothetical protein VFO37_07400 [Chitinophagaceae bacterium]|nr:hypothetical protein [Chitinophagaceae bacterium]